MTMPMWGLAVFGFQNGGAILIGDVFARVDDGFEQIAIIELVGNAR